VRVRLDGITLAQVLGKTKLKNSAGGKLVGRAVAFGGVGVRPPPFHFGAAAFIFTSFKAKAGGLGETRTLDQCLKRALLYRLSYQPNRAEENRLKPPERKNFPPLQSPVPILIVICYDLKKIIHRRNSVGRNPRAV
jgi:hypothetical protein